MTNEKVRDYADRVNESLGSVISCVNKKYNNADVVRTLKEEHETTAFRVFKEGLREPLKH